MEVFRDLVEVVLVTVVVGRVLARRGFSTSVFLVERTRPVLIVGAAEFRGDSDGRVRRTSVGDCLTGVISTLPRRRLARSSNCTELHFKHINLEDIDSTKLTRNVISATAVSMRITNG